MRVKTKKMERWRKVGWALERTGALMRDAISSGKEKSKESEMEAVARAEQSKRGIR